MKCCVCGKEFSGFGNNPYPFPDILYYPDSMEEVDRRCCDFCNFSFIIPLRLNKEYLKKMVSHATRVLRKKKLTKIYNE